MSVVGVGLPDVSQEPCGENAIARDEPMPSRRGLAFVVLVCVALFFFRLGDRDLNSSHEARAAQNAQSMLEKGDWSIPLLFNDRLDLQKPPLFYWLVAIFGWINGGVVDPWMVRLPSAFSALGCVLMLMYVGRRLGRPRTGLLAALILATSLHFTWLARVGRIDMPLTFALTVAIGASMIGRRESGNALGFGWHLLSYFAVAMGVMLKGPLALVLFFLWQVSAWCMAWRRRPIASAGVHRSTWWWGVPLVLCLVLPWFLWANWKTENQLFEVFFWYHNVQRGLGSGENLSSYPLWYYVPRLAVDLFPWSCVLPWALWRFWRQCASERNEVARAGLMWFGVFFVFFSLMSFKRADYLLPLYPGIALFLGAILDDRKRTLECGDSSPLSQRAKNADKSLFVSDIQSGDESPHSKARWVQLLSLVTCVGWIGYVQFFDGETRDGWAWQRQAREIRSHTDRPVIFFRTEAHALAFHVGRPLDTILEWENLDIWASERGLIYFVMPPECADEWGKHLRKGRLVEHGRIEDASRPLVVMHSVP